MITQLFRLEEMTSAAVSSCQQSQKSRPVQLESLIKPARQDDETQAQYLWRFLRFALKEAVQLVIQFEETDLAVSHGMYYVRRILHDEPIFQVYYMKSTEVRIFN